MQTSAAQTQTMKFGITAHVSAGTGKMIVQFSVPSCFHHPCTVLTETNTENSNDRIDLTGTQTGVLSLVRGITFPSLIVDPYDPDMTRD